MQRFLVLGFVMMLGGCAVTEVALKGNDAPWPGSGKVTPVAGSSKAVHIVEVTDAREKKEIGVARTGVQYTETPIVIREDMRSYLNKYFAKALADRNVAVSEASPVNLRITINELWLTEVLNNNEAAKCTANFSFTGDEKTPTTTKDWKGSFRTEYQSVGDMGDATEKMGPTLATCLNNVVEKLTADKSFQDFIRQ